MIDEWSRSVYNGEQFAKIFAIQHFDGAKNGFKLLVSTALGIKAVLVLNRPFSGRGAAVEHINS